MNQVKIFYQCRDQGTELVNHETVVGTHQELCKTIDDYPWDKELELLEALGEGGGFYFLLGDEATKYAGYQLVPIDTDQALLNLDIVMKPGFLSLFGRKAVSKDFDRVSIAGAKAELKALFNYSIDALYAKYQ